MFAALYMYISECIWNSSCIALHSTAKCIKEAKSQKVFHFAFHLQINQRKMLILETLHLTWKRFLLLQNQVKTGSKNSNNFKFEQFFVVGGLRKQRKMIITFEILLRWVWLLKNLLHIFADSWEWAENISTFTERKFPGGFKAEVIN